MLLIHLIAALARLHSRSHVHYPLPQVLSVSCAPVNFTLTFTTLTLFISTGYLGKFSFCCIQQINPLNYLSQHISHNSCCNAVTSFTLEFSLFLSSMISCSPGLSPTALATLDPEMLVFLGLLS